MTALYKKVINNSRLATFWVIFMAVLILASVVLAQSLSHIKFEAESGSLSGVASSSTDSSASGGAFVRFQNPSATYNVDILDFEYRNPVILARVGDMVSWTNKSTENVPHTVTSTAGVFDSGFLDANQTFTWTFNSVGTYHYLCSFHTSMTGRVEVSAQ